MEEEILFNDGSFINEIRTYLENRPEKVNYVGSRDMRTPLIHACINNRTDIIDLLFEFGADVNIVGAGKKTALHVACQYGDLAVVSRLISRNPTITQDCYGWTALHYAAERGDINIANMILPLCNPIECSLGGNTPFHFACGAGNLDMVEMLLQYTNINSINSCGQTGLHLAGMRRHVSIVKFLLENNADKSIKDYNDMTAAQLVSRLGGDEARKVRESFSF